MMLFPTTPLSEPCVYSAVFGVFRKREAPLQDLMAAECVPDVLQLLSKSFALFGLFVLLLFVEKRRFLLHVCL